MDRYKRRHITGALTDPPLVEAVRLSKENADAVAEWCVGKRVKEIDPHNSEKWWVGLNLITWNGMQRASEGDWILRDPIGDFHVRWHEVFVQQFEQDS